MLYIHNLRKLRPVWVDSNELEDVKTALEKETKAPSSQIFFLEKGARLPFPTSQEDLNKMLLVAIREDGMMYGVMPSAKGGRRSRRSRSRRSRRARSRRAKSRR